MTCSYKKSVSGRKRSPVRQGKRQKRSLSPVKRPASKSVRRSVRRSGRRQVKRSPLRFSFGKTSSCGCGN